MPTPKSLKPIEQKWAKCNACPYGSRTTTRPLYRGNTKKESKRVDILFIGEAPGKQEDLHGEPFIGPSGKLLQFLIHEVQRKMRWRFRYGIVNTVLCTPFPDGKNKPETPIPLAVEKCEDRVREVAEALQPKVIVTLGKIAEGYILDTGIDVDLRCPYLLLKHPAWVLRKGGATTTTYKKWMFEFLDALTELKDNNFKRVV